MTLGIGKHHNTQNGFNVNAGFVCLSIFIDFFLTNAIFGLK